MHLYATCMCLSVYATCINTCVYLCLHYCQNAYLIQLFISSVMNHITVVILFQSYYPPEVNINIAWSTKPIVDDVNRHQWRVWLATPP